MKNIKTIIAILSLLAAAGANAKDLDYFSHKDWALSCDNIGTCYAEGYQSENYQDDAEPSAPISMLITRQAGAHSKVDIQVQYIPNWDQENYIYGDTGKFQIGEVKVDNFDIKSGGWHLSDAQVKLVLPELLKQPYALITDGKTNWKLSLAGAKAVLLKMDEKQGRLSTPTALVQKGNRKDKLVPNPQPTPIIYAVRPVKAQPKDMSLAKHIFKELRLNKDGDYWCSIDNLDVSALQVGRLTANKVLLSYSCVAGAYNSAGMHWIANDKPPYQPQLLEVEGESYSDGQIFGSWKGRGLGDCWSSKTWVFDGKGFVLSESNSDMMCRGFMGGAWGVKQFVSKVVKKWRIQLVSATTRT